jgi:hypothetical protein
MSAVRAALQVAALMAVPCTLLCLLLWLMTGMPT